MDVDSAAGKPHVVCIPAPFQSHVKAMSQFAVILHHRGFHVTFMNSDFNHARFLKHGSPCSISGFDFKALPFGLPVSEPDEFPGYMAIFDAIMGNKLVPPFLEQLSRLNDRDNIPPVSCIVSDGFMPFTITAAKEIGVPFVYFYSVSACGLMGNHQLKPLKEKGVIPVKDVSCLEAVLDGIPGMKDIRLKDLSGFSRSQNLDNPAAEYTMGITSNVSKASAIVINTFEALEHDVLQGLSTIFPSVYAIGPLHLLVGRIPEQDPLKSITLDFYKEESHCLKWLNTRERNSVLYVNFGSIATLQPTQLTEFAWGLANSKQHFLWVFRPEPDDVSQSYKETLPPEFLEETKERGMISGWCPQKEVLDHPSLGGFLTHCGWNSTLESLCAGVPLICWPFHADQPPNSRYSCKEWGIGLEFDGNNVTREGVENSLRELMEGVKGEAIKDNVKKWQKEAIEATTTQDGSSFKNLNQLIDEILLSKS